MKFKRNVVYLTMLACLTTSAYAARTTDKPYADPIIYSMKADAALSKDLAKDAAAVIHRQVTLTNGDALSYTATTGHLVTEGSQQATVFYAAYTAENQNAATRPITFIFNGGPGEPATTLHITGWGPMRLISNLVTSGNINYEMQTSADTLLDKTDLVFIDPPGNGYSQAIEPATNKDFKPLDDDSSIYRDFILKYLKENRREVSPKYLYGESAGGPRAIYLAKKLNDAGVYFDGAVLNSPSTGRHVLCGRHVAPGISGSCSGKIPTVAALSWYYGLAGKGKTLDQFMAEVTTFVKNEYLPQELAALEDGTSLPDKMVDRLTEITGFSREMLGDFPYGEVLGPQVPLRNSYVDALGLSDCDKLPPAATNKPNPAHCPSWDVYDMRRQQDISYDMSHSRLNNYADSYIRTYLKYNSKVRYACKDDDCLIPDLKNDHITQPGSEGTWDGDTVPVLHQAMSDNQKLKILVISGYYDNQVPFGSALLSYSDPILDKSRIKMTVFEGGHMTYWDKNSRPKIKEALNAFFSSIKVENNRIVAAWNYPLPKEEFLRRVGATSPEGNVIIDMSDDKYLTLFSLPGKYEVPLKSGNSSIKVVLEVLKDGIPPVSGGEAPAYNSNIAYSTPCTRVSHNGKLWQNQWYVNPHQEEPGKGGLYGAWRIEKAKDNSCK